MGKEKTNTPILSVKNLAVRYEQQTIVEDITFDLHAGDFAMIIGPNGSGKTTLLKGVLGLVPTSNGSVTIDGHHGHLGCREIGYVPQRFHFDQSFPITVEEFLTLSVWYLKNPQPTVTERIRDALNLVGMSDHQATRLGVLSGGQLQRILIARALIHGPKLLVFDEPAAGIDVSGETNFYNLTKKLQSQAHLTILMVSHDIDAVYQHANHVLCLNKKLLCFGQPDSVLNSDIFQQLYGREVAPYHHQHKS